MPRHVLGRGFQAPSDTVNIATVGIGGMGGSNTRALMSQNIVAVCDVDCGLLDGGASQRYKADAGAHAGRPRRRPRQPARSGTKAQLDANARRAAAATAPRT